MTLKSTNFKPRSVEIALPITASEHGQRQGSPPLTSLLTPLPIPSMEELRVDYTTSATSHKHGYSILA